MSKYYYYIEDPVFSKKPKQLKLIRDARDKMIQRFNWETGKWIDDRDMIGIFIGRPEVNAVTEDEMNKFIQDNQ